MKLSTNFTLFGLNVKAIQAYLKEQAKDRAGFASPAVVIWSISSRHTPRSSCPLSCMPT